MSDATKPAAALPWYAVDLYLKAKAVLADEQPDIEEAVFALEHAVITFEQRAPVHPDGRIITTR